MTVVGAKSTAGTPPAARGIQVRHAIERDRDFMVAQAPRLVATSPAHWRNPAKVLANYLEVMGRILRAPKADAGLLLAEDRMETPLGLILLVAVDGIGSGGKRYVAQIVVAEHRLESLLDPILIQAATAWSRKRGGCVMTVRDYWLAHPACVVGNPLNPATSPPAPTTATRSPARCR